MNRKYPEITFTDSVKDRQQHYGVRENAKRMEELRMDDRQLSITEIAFISERDSFYMATVNEDGWPYVQYRGGPRGFLKPIDEKTLAYADYRGNRQLISVGNLHANDRVSLFLMDYPNRKRLKVLARSEVLDADECPELRKRVEEPGYPAEVERVVVFHLVAFDWNCPQHITPRFTEAELEALATGE